MGFVMEIGPREPGLLNWLKFRKEGCARGYLYFWRVWWSSFKLSHYSREPMSRLAGIHPCLGYAQADHGRMVLNDYFLIYLSAARIDEWARPRLSDPRPAVECGACNAMFDALTKPARTAPQSMKNYAARVADIQGVPHGHR